MANAPDLKLFRKQVASLSRATGEERQIIAGILNEMLRAMRAPGNDEAEAAAILAELELGTLSDLHDEHAVSCRAEAVETLLAMGFPHSLGVDPEDAAHAEALRRPSFLRCPLCDWRHSGGEWWKCERCGSAVDPFASGGRCKCGRVSKMTQCRGCKVSSPHEAFYVYGKNDDPHASVLHARCPKCLWVWNAWHHEGDTYWGCSCGHTINTFASRGLCSHCGRQWHDTACPKCGQWSPHLEWYAYGKAKKYFGIPYVPPEE